MNRNIAKAVLFVLIAVLYTMLIIAMVGNYSDAQEVSKVDTQSVELCPMCFADTVVEVSRGNSFENREAPVEEAPQPVYEYTEDELQLLARMIYTEARGESYDTKLKVASVALNRAMSGYFAPTIEEVVTQPRQFCYGEKTNEECLKAAKEVLDRGSILPPDVQVFYADGCTERWVCSRAVYGQSDSTVFAYIYEKGSAPDYETGR
jgi:N-acetylmuramoyl-L-alanine amidase